MDSLSKLFALKKKGKHDADQDHGDRLLEEVKELLSNAINRIPADKREQLRVQIISPSPQTVNGVCITRGVAITPFWALSVKAQPSCVEFFLFPANNQHSMFRAESMANMKVHLDWSKRDEAWQMNGTSINSQDLAALVQSLFRDLVTKSQMDQQMVPEELRLVPGPDGKSLTGSVRDLIAEKYQLIQVLVNQQEQLQASWARDLHDTAIGDILALKRAIANGHQPSHEELTQFLDALHNELRGLCHELTPRDINDYGLAVVLQETLDRLAIRANIDVALDQQVDLPPLPPEVALHVYRIVQESLHNIEKYAGATKIRVRFMQREEMLLIRIEDNGCGINSLPRAKVVVPGEKRPAGGTGMGIMRERAALISQIIPAALSVDSDSHGTRVTLSLAIAALNPDAL